MSDERNAAIVDIIDVAGKYLADSVGGPMQVSSALMALIVRRAIGDIHRHALIDIKVVGDLSVISIIAQTPEGRVMLDDLGRMLDATRPAGQPGGYRNQDDLAREATAREEARVQAERIGPLEPADADATPVAEGAEPDNGA